MRTHSPSSVIRALLFVVVASTVVLPPKLLNQQRRVLVQLRVLFKVVVSPRLRRVNVLRYYIVTVLARLPLPLLASGS